ncbi:MAG: ATP-binding cassette domain-containing protein, partial [Bacteroidia bacterium]|nr:ATP-binding cassette domain-containing protein [Bacteroidia bacterium]
TCITGVSGSGKTTLIRDILFPALQNFTQKTKNPAIRSRYEKLQVHPEYVNHVSYVDQTSLSRNLRSNPVTYLGVFDAIRELFGNLPASKERGLSAFHFSFNTDGGRCDYCKGEGMLFVEMQFLPDIELPCEICDGKRYKKHVLEVEYKGKSIYDVLQLSVQEAVEFFRDKPKIVNKLQILADIGLDYLRLGQSTTTLSGGEAQRLKLAQFLSTQEYSKPGIFIFDEPTTGLHLHDIQKLLIAFGKLVDSGHTLIVIEHQLDVIKCADWIIDLGPEGGKDGGHLVYQGTPVGLTRITHSYTGRFLQEKIGN